MSRTQKLALFWVAVVLIVFVSFVLFRPILLPFIAGAILAYALDPAADWLERRGMSRLGATLFILVLLSLGFVFVILLLVPLLLNQLTDFARALPTYITRLQELFGSVLESDVAHFLGIDVESIRGSLGSFMSRGVDLASAVLASLWTGGRTLLDVGSLFVVTPFVAFYFLRDWDWIVAWVDQLIPRDHVETVRRLGREIDQKVAAFVRGQILVGTLLGIFYAAGLMIVGLNYGLLIGLASGILSFIPYLGFAVGFVAAIAIAIVQFWPDWIMLAATVGVFVVGQLIEGYVLQPRILGRSVGLHPVWLLFALFAFGYLLGFLGLLIAVPLAAAVGVLLRYAIERYRASSVFGEAQGRPEA